MDISRIDETRTYLTFTLDSEDFAVEVSNVREVLDLTAITKVPRMPPYMRGVINLRGTVVPVVDMRVKFNLPVTEDTVDTCIIVLEVDLEGERTMIGALSDSVKEVLELDSENIEPPPRIGTRLDTEFIRGMGRHNEQFIIVLDIDRVFSLAELEIIEMAGRDIPGHGGDDAEALSEGGARPGRKSGRKKARSQSREEHDMETAAAGDAASSSE